MSGPSRVYERRGRVTRRDRRWRVQATPHRQKNTTFTYHRTRAFAALSVALFALIGYDVEVWDQGHR